MRDPEGGNILVFEAVLVACVMLGAVLLISTLDAPTTGTVNTRAHLADTAGDALLVLQELPPSNASAYESRLEELVTDGLRGDCSGFREKLGGYFAPGATYALHLENGYGGRRPICAFGDVDGEHVTRSALIQPTWTHVFVRPNVTQVPGRVPLDADNKSDAYNHPLSFQMVPVWHGYLDERESMKLFFENGFNVTVDPRMQVRYSGQLPPERVTASGHRDGHTVPYDTDNGLLAYDASSTDLSQPEVDYMPRTNVPSPPGHEGAFTVHPKYVLASPISASIVSMVPEDRFSPSARNVTLGDAVRLSWNYGQIARTMPSSELSDGVLRVYNPAGALEYATPVENYTSDTVYHVPLEALWGTHVAHLQFRVSELDGTGQETGIVYVINQLTHFTVKHPGWVSEPKHSPPVYRVSLSAGAGTGQ